jgi:NADH:ubiquinone oxidoreductase subunit
MKVVWTVVERGPGKSFWTRVGVGFVNRDGSITLRLDAIPISGTLQVREWQEPYERRPDATDTAPRPRARPQPTGDSQL